VECEYFGRCGSCTLYKQSCEERLEYKKEHFSKILHQFYDREIALFGSPSRNYRARAEFRIWHEDNRCSYAMNSIDAKGLTVIRKCPKTIRAIYDRMEPLMQIVNASKELSHRLFGVEFLAATTGECLVTMLYHRKLDEKWKNQALEICRELDCSTIGRSRKQKVLCGRDYVTERIKAGDQVYIYHHHEGGFTQPNPCLNSKMIAWAKQQAASIGGGDLLELYCGAGNFTIPLAGHFEKVLATEVSKRSIKSAMENCILNNIDNIDFIRLSSAETCSALKKEREFRRLKEKNLELEQYDFKCLLVDPPRAGLDEESRKLPDHLSI